jgi:hypothetical protein
MREMADPVLAAQQGERFDLKGWRDEDLIRLVRAFASDLEQKHGRDPGFPSSLWSSMREIADRFERASKRVTGRKR